MQYTKEVFVFVFVSSTKLSMGKPDQRTAPRRRNFPQTEFLESRTSNSHQALSTSTASPSFGVCNMHRLHAINYRAMRLIVLKKVWRITLRVLDIRSDATPRMYPRLGLGCIPRQAFCSPVALTSSRVVQSHKGVFSKIPEFNLMAKTFWGFAKASSCIWLYNSHYTCFMAPHRRTASSWLFAYIGLVVRKNYQYMYIEVHQWDGHILTKGCCTQKRTFVCIDDHFWSIDKARIDATIPPYKDTSDRQLDWRQRVAQPTQARCKRRNWIWRLRCWWTNKQCYRRTSVVNWFGSTLPGQFRWHAKLMEKMHPIDDVQTARPSASSSLGWREVRAFANSQVLPWRQKVGCVGL